MDQPANNPVVPSQNPVQQQSTASASSDSDAMPQVQTSASATDGVSVSPAQGTQTDGNIPSQVLQDVPAVPETQSAESSDLSAGVAESAVVEAKPDQTEPVTTAPVDMAAQQVIADQPVAASDQVPPAASTSLSDSADQDQQTDTQEADSKEEQIISLQNDIPVPPNAVSGPLKEFGPPIAAPAEVVTPSDMEPDIPQEVKEAGVEATPNTDQPQISQAVSQTTGIKPANDAIPVPTVPSDMISLPMPEPEAAQTIKTHKVVDSIRWLATLVIEQAKRAHGQLLGK